jgi:hypothetical protein
VAQLIVVALMIASLLDGMVVCFGQDGHVAIEPASAPHGSPGLHAHEGLPHTEPCDAGSRAPARGHGPCVDVLIVAELSRAGGDPGLSGHAAVLPAGAPLVRRPDPVTAVLDAFDRPAPVAMLGHLRGTLLRI